MIGNSLINNYQNILSCHPGWRVWLQKLLITSKSRFFFLQGRGSEDELRCVICKAKVGVRCEEGTPNGKCARDSWGRLDRLGVTVWKCQRREFKQTPFKPLNSVCILKNGFNSSRSITLMRNQLFVLLRDLAHLAASCVAHVSSLFSSCQRRRGRKKGGWNITIFGKGYKACNDNICIHSMRRN